MDGVLQIRLWGVRGNSAPFQASTEFGNHTTCIEVGVDGFPSVLVDMGSGAVPAARDFLAREPGITPSMGNSTFSAAERAGIK